MYDNNHGSLWKTTYKNHKRVFVDTGVYRRCKIENNEIDKCIDSEGVGYKTVANSCSSTDSQHWKFEEISRLKTNANGKYLSGGRNCDVGFSSNTGFFEVWIMVPDGFSTESTGDGWLVHAASDNKLKCGRTRGMGMGICGKSTVTCQVGVP